MATLAQDSATYFGGFLVTTVINLVIWSAARVSSFYLCVAVGSPRFLDNAFQPSLIAVAVG